MARKTNKLGKWAFILGVLLAVIAGALSVLVGVESSVLQQGLVALILVVLGIIIGLLNIQEKEAINFLVATIALMAVGTAGVDTIGIFNLGAYFKAVVTYIAIFVAPAAVIVSLKLVFDLARD